MVWISYLLAALAIGYIAFIVYVTIFWFVRQTAHLSFDDLPPASVLIPCRNEEKTIADCMASISFQNPGEIVVIDDHSSDKTYSVVQARLRADDQLISNTDNGKKAAIKTGVASAQYPNILCTDGDSFVSRNWVKIMSMALKKNALVFGPVFVKNPLSWVEAFQQFDGIATAAVSGVGQWNKLFYSGTGANMGFRKKNFISITPFDNNIEIASGDDIFLIEHMRRANYPISYIKHPDAYVHTIPKRNWTTLVKQRVRWAAKTKYYKDKNLKIFWLIMGFAQLGFILMMLFVLFGISIKLFVVMWIGKIFVDFLLIKSVSHYYAIKIQWSYFLPSIILYPFFVLFVAIRSLYFNKMAW